MEDIQGVCVATLPVQKSVFALENVPEKIGKKHCGLQTAESGIK